MNEDDVRMTGQAVAILRPTTDNAAHRDELLAAAGLGTAYGNYRRHIAPLVEQGLLAMTFPDMPTSKHQRYRITDRGRQALDRTAE